MIVVMGFFSSLFGCSKNDEGSGEKDGFVSKQSFRENLAKQAAMSPETVRQLRKHDVTDETTLKLEFFFYTDTQEKAEALAAPLRTFHYEVETGPSAGDDGLVLVTGWSLPSKMDERSVVAWTEKMCRLGFKHDCEFDGWGTNPDQ